MPCGPTKVLFVDDERSILFVMKRWLEKDFEVHTAESGPEGLALLEREGPFSVVVSDLHMPPQDGFAFLEEVHRLFPDLPCVLLTGLPQPPALGDLPSYIRGVLEKPIRMEELMAALQHAVGAPIG